jgi:Icc-related predicted phosphoesterase
MHGMIRIAAAGDVHCRPEDRERILGEFAELRGSIDLVLLAGDLTTHGEPEQAAVLAEACAGLDVPVVAVLGNHDWHCDRAGEVVGVLADAGITVLDRSWCVTRVGDVDVGVVGAKGFVGGFPGSHLPDFGEPLLRAVYREASEDIDAIDAGLRELAMCPVRIVLLHYAPTDETLAGEPPGIWPFLGTDRLAAPIAEHEPNLVLHGHAHAGTFEGRIGDVPVRNVSVPVLRAPFWHHELPVAERAPAPIH